MASEVQQYYANHRWYVIGGLAAAVAAFVGIIQLRKSPTPAITITAPAASSGTAGFSPSDVLGAYQAGAGASTAGLGAAVGLGQGGMDLAAAALQAESGTLQALGGTQASMGGSLSDVLKELIDKGYPAPVAPPAANPRIYIFQTGDTIESIAEHFNSTWQDICNANQLGAGCNPGGVLPLGFRLVIP